MPSAGQAAVDATAGVIHVVAPGPIEGVLEEVAEHSPHRAVLATECLLQVVVKALGVLLVAEMLHHLRRGQVRGKARAGKGEEVCGEISHSRGPFEPSFRTLPFKRAAATEVLARPPTGPTRRCLEGGAAWYFRGYALVSGFSMKLCTLLVHGRWENKIRGGWEWDNCPSAHMGRIPNTYESDPHETLIIWRLLTTTTEPSPGPSLTEEDS